MKTIGQYNLEKIIELRSKIDELNDEIDELESNLIGAEINHPDYFYCIVDFINGEDVHLYAEDEDEEQYDLIVTIEEFQKYL